MLTFVTQTSELYCGMYMISCSPGPLNNLQHECYDDLTMFQRGLLSGQFEKVFQKMCNCANLCWSPWILPKIIYQENLKLQNDSLDKEAND